MPGSRGIGPWKKSTRIINRNKKKPRYLHEAEIQAVFTLILLEKSCKEREYQTNKGTKKKPQLLAHS